MDAVPHPELKGTLAIGDVLAGRFEVRGVVGDGPLGTVYRAFDRDTEVEVAAKVLKSSLFTSAVERDAFLGACADTRKLSHPNLVRIFFAHADEGAIFFAMQLLDGLSLRKVLDLRREKGQPFSLAEAEPIVAQIALALEHAHRVAANGNLKPENILILPDLLKVTDFHLSAALPRGAYLEAERAAPSSPYMAPEVRAGGPISLAADVYSFALIVSELVSGKIPDGPDVHFKSLNPELPVRLDAIIQPCLAPEPIVRVSDPAHIAKGLRELVGDDPSIPEVSRVRGALTRTSRVGAGPFSDRASTPRPMPAPPAPSEGARPSTPKPALPPLPSASRRPFDSEPPFSGDSRARARSTSAKTPTPTPTSRPPWAEGSGVSASGARGAAQPERSAVSASAPRPTPAQSRESGPLEAVLPPGSQPPILSPPPRRQIPLPVWITAIVAVVAGGTYGVIRYLDHLQGEEELKLLTEQQRQKDALERERLRQEAQRAQEALKERTVAEAAARERARQLEAEKEALAAKPPEVVLPPPEEESVPQRRKREKEALRQKERRRRKEREPEKVAVVPRQEAKVETPLVAKEKPKETVVASAATTAPVEEKKKKCPGGMARIKAGSFRMGSASDDPMRNFGEKLLARVATEEYCIDRYEYPNSRGAMPLVGISWNQAKEMCEAKGKRLCTEAEWERACKGYSGYRFPYGDDFEDDKCNTQSSKGEKRSIARAGSFSECRSGFGVSDLSGNVAEWTATPLSPGSGARIIKGGSSNKPDWAVRCANRGNKPAGGRDGYLGFRCCANPE
jgi:formylglycine-generating enzyme required for sulfatase activity/serine/threonine protein kinase